MRIRCVFLTALVFGMGLISFGQHISPAESGSRIDMVAPTTRPWYEADDSLVSLNTGLDFGDSDGMIQIMKEGLLGEQLLFAQSVSAAKNYVREISEALYRSGDSPEITNILHQSLLIQTNLNCGIALPPDWIKKAPGPDSIKTNLYRAE